MVPEQSNYLQADDPEISKKRGNKAEPHEETVGPHELIVKLEMSQYAVFNVFTFAHVKNDEIGCIVGYVANDKTDPDGGDVSRCYSDDWQKQAGGADHAIEQTQNGHGRAENLAFVEGISLLFLHEHLSLINFVNDDVI